MINLDAVARRYGTLPSRVLGVENPFLALTIDVEAAIQGSEHEVKQVERARRRGRR